jgi:hypothetical protein
MTFSGICAAAFLSTGEFDRLRRTCLRFGTGDESDISAGAREGFCKLLSIFSNKKLSLEDFVFADSSTLLLDREKILRPPPNSCPFNLLRFALEVGHSALQLIDLLKLEESLLVPAEAGVWGEDERRLARRGGGKLSSGLIEALPR